MVFENFINWELLLETIYKLVAIPQKLDALSKDIIRLESKIDNVKIIETEEKIKPAELQLEINKLEKTDECSDCIKLTQAVSFKTVEFIFGSVREMLVNARGAIKDGIDKYAAIPIINNAIEVLSAPLPTIKERNKDTIQNREETPNKEKKPHPKSIDWRGKAIELGYSSQKEMFKDLYTNQKLNIKDIAAKFGVHYTTIYLKIKKYEF